MADAVDSKSSGITPVSVRLRPPAISNSRKPTRNNGVGFFLVDHNRITFRPVSSMWVLPLRIFHPANILLRHCVCKLLPIPEVHMAQVLVIEQDGRQFEQLKQCFLAKGHKAWRATTVAEALTFLNRYGVDLILCTVHLEEGDVFEFLRTVKSSAKQKHIPFVFYCLDELRRERFATPVITCAGKALGARKYVLLTKFDGARFWDEVEDCIPENSLKNDSLGGEVIKYSLSDLSWTKGAKKAS